MVLNGGYFGANPALASISSARRGGHYGLMAFLLSETTLSQVPATRPAEQDTAAIRAKPHLKSTLVAKTTVVKVSNLSVGVASRHPRYGNYNYNYKC